MKNRKSGDAGIKYDPAQVRIHEAYTVAIRDLGVHGEGIGSVDGFTVFVPGALPGETVTAKITLLKKSYTLGKLLSIEQESPFRMVPECPVYEHCGGCQLSHLTYEGQLDMKYRRVKDVIERIAGESGDLVKPVLPAAHPFAYRNKMAVPAGLVKRKAALGCYRQGSHDIIPVSSCAIQKEENNRLLQFARWFIEKYGISVYDEKTCPKQFPSGTISSPSREIRYWARKSDTSGAEKRSLPLFADCDLKYPRTPSFRCIKSRRKFSMRKHWHTPI